MKILSMLYILVLKSILGMFRFINKYINIIITYTNKKVELSDKGYLSLVRSVYQPKGRYIELTYSNNYLLEQYKVLKELHKSLFSNDEFLKFGYQKVIIVMAVVGKQTFSHACFIIIYLLIIILHLNSIITRLKIISTIYTMMVMKLIKWITLKY